MKKESFALLLSGLLAVSVAACGNADGMDGGAASPGQESGSGNPQEVAEDAGEKAPEESESAATENKVPVTHTTAKGSIALDIPESWEYEVDEQKDGYFSIFVHPLSETKKGITVECTDFFGVCGTGLEEKACMVNGMEARKGIYDEKSHWSFIAFTGDYDGYVVQSMAGKSWWKEYGSQVDGILASLAFSPKS